MNTISERVERGAALLDKKHPSGRDWIWVIDLDQLDIASPCDCTSGQIGRQLVPHSPAVWAYAEGLSALGLEGYQAPAYGFDSDDSDLDDEPIAEVQAEFAALTEAWRDLITRRRDEASVPA